MFFFVLLRGGVFVFAVVPGGTVLLFLHGGVLFAFDARSVIFFVVAARGRVFVFAVDAPERSHWSCFRTESRSSVGCRCIFTQNCALTWSIFILRRSSSYFRSESGSGVERPHVFTPNCALARNVEIPCIFAQNCNLARSVLTCSSMQNDALEHFHIFTQNCALAWSNNTFGLVAHVTEQRWEVD